MKKNKRDEFPRRIREMLAKRAGYRCSNPTCGILCIGPCTTPGNAEQLWKASHITSAASKGPRFDSSLTSDERRSFANGICLCGICADKIDKNLGAGYSVETLRQWKTNRERAAEEEIGKPSFSAIHPQIGWFCSASESKKNITGNGTSTLVDFSKCKGPVRNGVFTCQSPGKYQMNWCIVFANITTQKVALLNLEASNESQVFKYDILSLKTSDNTLVLRGTARIQCDLIDIVKIYASIGTTSDAKTVHLSASDSNYVRGELFNPD